MATEERKQQLFKQIHDSVVAYDEETCEQLCKTVLEEGVDAYEAIIKGLAAGMDTVGELYEKRDYFVPELLLCSDTMYTGMDILRPHIKKSLDTKEAAKIVIGVVEGDIHDIGKNIVKTMFEAAGWEVHDLDKDVKPQRFVEEMQRTNAQVVAISALMTASMLGIPKVIKLIKAQNPDVLVMVGGAPLSPEIALKFGADGYAPDAVSAVHEARRLLNKVA